MCHLLTPEVIEEPHDMYPGICRMKTSSGWIYGYFVPYQDVRLARASYSRNKRIVINLLVEDLSSTFAGFMPFVIDTGCDTTILPRNLVPSNAFPVETNHSRIYVNGIGGGRIVGTPSRVSLSIVSQSVQFKILELGILQEAVVVDKSWELRFALLGLDALQHVTMVTDNEFAYFYPSSASRRS